MSCCQTNSFNFECATETQVNIGTHFVWDTQLVLEDGPVDLTGYDINGTIKDVPGGTTLLSLSVQLTELTTGFFIDDQTDEDLKGIITFTITAADSDTIASGIYPYQFILTNSFGQDFIYLQGTIQFYTEDF